MIVLRRGNIVHASKLSCAETVATVIPELTREEEKLTSRTTWHVQKTSCTSFHRLSSFILIRWIIEDTEVTSIFMKQTSTCYDLWCGACSNKNWSSNFPRKRLNVIHISGTFQLADKLQRAHTPKKHPHSRYLNMTQIFHYAFLL